MKNKGLLAESEDESIAEGEFNIENNPCCANVTQNK